MKSVRFIVIGALVIGSATTSLMIRHEAQVKRRENDRVLSQQQDLLAELEADNQHLSKPIAQSEGSIRENQASELANLRAVAEALRKQTNDLATQLATNRRSQPPPPASRPVFRTYLMAGVSVVSNSDSEEYAKQLERIAIDAGKKTDARKISSAVRQHARKHDGQFPSEIDQAAAHFDEDQPPPRTSGFEMVFQGSLADLAHIPLQAVALIRERDAWRTPRGNWARIYLMVGGELHIVESDDNFQSWEAEHVIPPASADGR